MHASEYWTEIADIVSEAERLIRIGEVDPDEIGDWLHETIDGHQFVIYTAQARDVLVHSPNDCAIFEEMGPQSWEDWSTAFSQAAYFAMCADVNERLDPHSVELDPEKEGDE